MPRNISLQSIQDAFLPSPPSEGSFAASPAGRVLQHARKEMSESDFRAMFALSPEPVNRPLRSTGNGDASSSVSGGSLPSLSQQPPGRRHQDAVLEQIAQTVYKDEDEDDESDAESLDSEESPMSQDESGDGGSDFGDDRSHRHARMSTVQKSSLTTIPNCPDSQKSSRIISRQSQAGTLFSAGSQRSVASSSALTNAEAYELLGNYKGKLPRKLTHQRNMHFALANSAFSSFNCKCEFAQGADSCLDSGFDRGDFRAIHQKTYGRNDKLHSATEVKTAVHRAVHELRVPLTTSGCDGSLFYVPEWRIGGANGRRVCRKAFITVLGGTPNAHRGALTLTRAGKDPSDAKAAKDAAVAVKWSKTLIGPRAQFAVSWWKEHLMWHDWLPNEIKIQYRGPTWNVVHRDFYEPLAKAAGQFLKMKQWMRNRKRALSELHAEYFASVTNRTLVVARSARHSKFPECTDCQRLRTEYKKVASNPRATPAQVCPISSVDCTSNWIVL